jgi:hypothetical protein
VQPPPWRSRGVDDDDDDNGNLEELGGVPGSEKKTSKNM